MFLSFEGIVPPKEWEHKPELRDESGYTVAMFISRFCK